MVVTGVLRLAVDDEAPRIPDFVFCRYWDFADRAPGPGSTTGENNRNKGGEPFARALSRMADPCPEKEWRTPARVLWWKGGARVSVRPDGFHAVVRRGRDVELSESGDGWSH